MPQEDNSRLRPLVTLFKRLFGGGEEAPPTPATQIAAPPLVITDENRADLVHLAQTAPFAYGYWSQVKRLYKAAEAAQDIPLLTALITRLDTLPFAAKPEMLPTPFNTLFTQFTRDSISEIQAVGTTVYLVVQGNQAGLHIVDVADPVQPTPLAHVPIKNPMGLVISGPRAYVSSGERYGRQDNELKIFDISNPQNPIVLGKTEVKTAAKLALMGQYALVLSNSYNASALNVLDVSDPQNMLTLSKITIEDPGAIAVRGQTAFILINKGRSQQQKINAYNLSNPRKPTLITSLDTPDATDIAVVGDTLYITLGYTYYSSRQQGRVGLALYNVTGATPRLTGFVEVGSARSVAVQGRYAYVGVGGPDPSDLTASGIRIVDVADPTTPLQVGTLAGGLVTHVALAETAPNHLYFGMRQENYGQSCFCVADIGRPDRPFLLGQAPSNETFGYMKRRARRALRTLAAQDPAQYVTLATQILISTGKDKQEIDPRIQWVTMDILFGKSQRYEQAGHGRGAYLLRGSRFSLRTREEAYPALWDRHPLLVESLFTHAELPWQTHEAACKMLRDMKRALPALGDAALLRFLQSPSALLTVVATRALASRLNADQTIAADLAAETFYRGSGLARKAVREFIARQNALGSRWTNAFASRLYKLASENIVKAQLTRRQSLAFAYLVAAYPTVLGRQVAPDLAVSLYITRRPELQEWTLATLRQSPGIFIDQWLLALEAVPEDLRDKAIAALTEGVQSQEFSKNLLNTLVFHTSPWIRTTGWDLIAASKTPDAVLTALWNDLLAAETETDALRTASASPAAILLFNRLPLNGERLQSLLETRPFLVGLLPASALQNILFVLPPPSLLSLVRAAPETQWPELRQMIVRALQESTGTNRTAAFWKFAWKLIGETGEPILAARLLDDEVMRSTFLQLDNLLSDPEFLASANPIYSPILGLWLRAHADLFVPDSPLLLQVATHMLPDIRAFGLERVRQVGMQLPFALRLLESELPPAVELGKAFFETLTAGDNNELAYVLALCDSPKASVRAYGQQVLEARWSFLPHEEVFDRLAESTDPHMEAFLAGKMLRTDKSFTSFANAASFDRQVLRQRDRGRKAKELVKQRLTAEPSQDVSLLLELARSRSPRDAEWALGQLAQLALAGVEIDGVVVEN